MSTATSAPMTLDVSQTAKVPFSRLVQVKLRKMFDTRAGRWLVISIAALTALVLVIQLWVVLAQDLTVSFNDFAAGANIPMTILLPVLGIMSVTSEWSQRTAMVTFTLEPSRARFLAAKFVATLLVAITAVVVGLVLTVAANGLYAAFSDNVVTWKLGPFRILCYFLLHVLAMSTGFAFGALLLNTAAAIVVYFVYGFIISSLFKLGAALLDWFKDIRPWVDFSYAQNPIIEASVSGKEWAQLGDVRADLAGAPTRHRGVAGAPGRGEVATTSVDRMTASPRSDGRADDQLRPVTITRNWLDHAAGSVMRCSFRGASRRQTAVVVHCRCPLR